MRDILAEIVDKKREIVAVSKRQRPIEDIKAELEPDTFVMSKRFHKGDWNLIAECKLQSPAKGRLNQTHSVEQLAKIYEENGASMLSVHTDPHFLGSVEDFIRVRQQVQLPLLRKDFIIDEYQLYEARLLGANAVLLIARILSAEQLKEYLYTTWSLGMDALVEVHDEADMKAALATPAEFIGINNRNLKTFSTTIQQTLEFLPYADKKRVLISESGVFTADDARVLREAGCDGILVGEGLVRADDIGKKTQELITI